MNWNYELYKSAVTGSPLAQTETKKEEGLRSLTTRKEKRKEKEIKRRSEESEMPRQPKKKAKKTETKKEEGRDYYYERDKDGNVIKKTR